ncbi:MAG: reverse transcriptase N-terminal domain-containing protein [Limnospira sp. PMC 1291.21]|uniref:Group II intron maturase-specific domain protein n=1 Tax=Limnospira indica PCC 8005 TaxID=376219 RepID=A0A9P1KCS2_9CYAN|nr:MULTISPECIES: reverse transcriptase N-terminal domain-containing protein [Limnospira]MDT9177771.1 reverse transcriptase N-terminal domain-containing protein [Limnospira sp. PMC 1238.20]MDT9193028.1 reverse transcriptase N-terminal domain-containing protein [Limnospira sp. PMC 1245.20]MDT9202208.1 reverse transcriptase N-terminal domain-containing protein [Limnospira sp. PMC 1243.20]MDT9209756.1 reverse transcriptase N-terminal domain-containing protein [Limnospira sp. PMC 1252.20]MDT9213733
MKSETSVKTTERLEWGDINWKKVERRLFRLQKRIYKASKRGDFKAVRYLQKLLLKSWSAKVLAVRSVTQDNQGKNTAGVDGVKSLCSQARINLVGQLTLGAKPKPTHRVDSTETVVNAPSRNGEQTIFCRAGQGLVRLALEPEWEAKFESNCYGFRPGRSCHDAIKAISNHLESEPKWVLDTQITKCLSDRINGDRLLDKLGTFPKLRRQIRAWLKSGVMDGKQLFPTKEGTPPGGLIQPLLAHIALHGIEEDILKMADQLSGREPVNRHQLCLIRYADKLVILHQDAAVIHHSQQVIREWLKPWGLELKPEQTRIAHTLDGEDAGFDFLGFHIQQYRVGKYHSGKDRKGKSLGFKTIIKPSRNAVTEHYKLLVRVIDAHQAAPQAALIRRLNRIILRWSNYYSTVVSKEVLNKLDYLLFGKLRRWANRRHPHQSEKWVANKYWQSIDNRNWAFAVRGHEEIALFKHSQIHIFRYVKGKEAASAEDGNLSYGSTANCGNYQ